MGRALQRAPPPSATEVREAPPRTRRVPCCLPRRTAAGIWHLRGAASAPRRAGLLGYLHRPLAAATARLARPTQVRSVEHIGGL